MKKPVNDHKVGSACVIVSGNAWFDQIDKSFTPEGRAHNRHNEIIYQTLIPIYKLLE